MPDDFSSIPLPDDPSAATTPRENRKHARVQYFLVARDHEHLPVWVFKPEGHDGHAGLIVDASLGGMQVLTGDDGPIPGHRFEIKLLKDEGTRIHSVVAATRVWSRAVNHHTHLHGFSFDRPHASMSKIVAAYPQGSLTSPTWRRCLLVSVR